MIKIIPAHPRQPGSLTSHIGSSPYHPGSSSYHLGSSPYHLPIPGSFALVCSVAHQLEWASAANGRAVPHACRATAPCCAVFCYRAVRRRPGRANPYEGWAFITGARCCRVFRSSTTAVRPNHRETAQNARRRSNLLIQEYLHVSSISRHKPPCRVAPAQALGAPLPERANRDGTRDRESGKRIEAITIFKKRQGSMLTTPHPFTPHFRSGLK